MSQSTDIREGLIYELKSIVGKEYFEVVREDELRYEVRIRAFDGSYILIYMDKDSLGKMGRITFEICCHNQALHENRYILSKRFYSYNELHVFILKYQGLICDLIRNFIGFQESAFLLAKS